MTTYTISLDDVDLALLPMPTYSYNNFLKKENYQFQVMKTEVEPTTLYTCHICAIEMPAAFAYEHAASAKHRAHVRIASVAAERMRAFVSAPPPPCPAKPATRFCANCATEKKDGHDSTKEHRAAVVLDSLLWDLVKAYVHDDESNCDDNQTHGNKRDNVGKEDDVSYEKVNGGNSHIAKVTKIEDKETTKLIEDKSEIIDAFVQTEENCESDTEYSDDIELTGSVDANESINSDMYKNIKKKNVAEKGINVNWLEHYKENLRQFIGENDHFDYKESYNISIELNEYSLSNIDSKCFHSYQRIYFSDNVKCLVCDCVLDDVEADVHKNDYEHIRRVAKLGNNGYYVREIDELYSHCILCNEKIKTIDTMTHIESGRHNLQEWGHTNTRDVNKIKAAAEENKTKEVADKNKTKDAVENNNNITAEKTIDEPTTTSDIGSRIEYPYEMTTTGNVRCIVCECQVPRGERNREEHVQGLRHRTAVLNKKRTTKPPKDKYEEELRKFINDEYYFEFEELTWETFRLQLDNYILEAYTIRFHSFYPVGDEKFKCQVCDCVFESDDEEEHTYDTEHLRQVANFENDGNFVRKINNLYSHCILCNDKMLNINVAQHKRSQKHKEERAQHVEIIPETDPE